MSVAQQLALLQDIDLEIDHLNAQAATVQVALGETLALQEARTAWQGDEADLDKKRGAVQEREWDVKEGQTKIASVETKLYSGQVTSSKDLTNLQRELESLKARQVKLDERLLEVMIAVEEAQGRTKANRQRFSQLEASWQGDQTRLRQEEASLQRQIANQQARRQAQVAGLDATALDIYQRLRVTKGGRAVAGLPGSICQGCRITLPSGDALRAKTSVSLVFCPNCGRILCK